MRALVATLLPELAAADDATAAKLAPYMKGAARGLPPVPAETVVLETAVAETRVAVVARERHLPPVRSGEQRLAGAGPGSAPAEDAILGEKPTSLRAAPSDTEGLAAPAPPTPSVQASADPMGKAAKAEGGVHPSAPGPVTPPAQQVAIAIAQNLDHQTLGRTETVVAGEVSFVAAPTSAQEPARLLRIALEPEQLGGVTVQLRQTVLGVHVVVAAERPATATLLERDSHLLSKILDASGLKVEDVTIRHPRPQEASATMAPRTDAVLAQPTSQTGPQLFAGAGSGERQQAHRSGARISGRDEEENGENSVVDDSRPVGDLYV